MMSVYLKYIFFIQCILSYTLSVQALDGDDDDASTMPVPDIVIDISFDEQIHCDTVQEYFESYVDRGTYDIVVDGEWCSNSDRKKRDTTYKYMVYLTYSVDGMPDDEETKRLKAKVCNDFTTFKNKVNGNVDLDCTNVTITTTSTITITATITLSVIPSNTDGPVEVETLTIIVPASVSFVLLIVVFTLIIVMCIVMQMRKTRIKRDKSKKPMWLATKPSMGELGPVRNQAVRPLRPSRFSFASRGNILLQTLSHPLSYEELIASLQDVDKLRSEYMGIPANLVGMNEIPVGTEDKNRYIDVLPNPNTRVPLFLKFGVAHSDFINANYVRGYRNQPKEYIATQGPLQHTIADFWRMVWEQKSSVIIMTTELIERNMEKCYQYWPDEKGYGVTEVYGDVQVTIRKKTKKSCYTITTFTVEHLERHVTREVTQYWFNGWPDHGVPQSAAGVVDFLLDTRTKRTGFTLPGPTVVHCSAGIGRTGVFIAADIGMRQLEDNMTADVLKILATMRQDRGGMVQTKDQYVFLHKVLHDFGTRIGHVSSFQYESDENLNHQFGQTAKNHCLEEIDEEETTTFR